VALERHPAPDLNSNLKLETCALLIPFIQAWSYMPDIFRIFYCTGWEHTVLHYRRVPVGGQQQTKGSEVSSHEAASARASWEEGVVPGSGG
jgi:hypothetical protein